MYLVRHEREQHKSSSTHLHTLIFIILWTNFETTLYMAACMVPDCVNVLYITRLGFLPPEGKGRRQDVIYDGSLRLTCVIKITFSNKVRPEPFS